MIDIRLPNITGKTDSEQLAQIKSYLYQFAGQLQWALSTVEVGNGGGTYIPVLKSDSSEEKKENTLSNFNQIKSLIIKSADIVNAYYEKIDELLKLSGDYTAQSDFGTFREETLNRISATNSMIAQNIYDLQSIYDVNGNIRAELLVNGHIYSGIIEYAKDGEAIVGIEIGQTTTGNGVKKFDKFARFTADKLSFYDANSIEVAYISDYKMVITEAHITGNLQLGNFFFDTSNGLALRPV
jgi:hypothetical protein